MTVLHLLRIRKDALLFCLLVVALPACALTAEREQRHTQLPADAWQPPATEYNKKLDGSGSWDVAPPDVPPLADVPAPTDGQDLPDVTQPSDIADVQDTAAPVDVVVPPDVPADVPPIYPAGPLQVMSAFSSDGKGIKVRFSKPLDATTAQVAKNYSLTDSASGAITVTGAQITEDPLIVALSFAAGQKFDGALTYTVLVKNVKSQEGDALASGKNKAVVKRTVYLQIMWHQHQPTYLDPIADVLTSPWVRKHATKDYYDMAGILQQYPAVHLTINLTPVMLNQLIGYYLDRLGPYVDTKNNTVDSAAFLAKWQGHTDPWIDLLLQPTPDPKVATPKQIGLLYADPWSCVSTAPVLMNRFPAYAALRDKNPATLTQQDLLGLKIWFELAWFDPDFLHGPVSLPTGDVVDLSDILAASAPTNATFTLKVPLSEQLANRIVAEEYKIMKAVIPIHKQLMYHAATHQGQIEIATTPFYHPILPLLQSTDLMGPGQPFDPKPVPPFSFPQDAAAQVGRAVAFYQGLFGEPPQGMWPGEGSVAEEVIQHFKKYNIQWVATDQAVQSASTGYHQDGSGADTTQAPQGPWVVDTDKQKPGQAGDLQNPLAIFFRNTQMSNDIGFKYQGLVGTDAAADLIKNVAAQAPSLGGSDRVITLVLDGENAWETFVKEHDGKGFFHALYSKLTDSQAAGEIITVTGAEYLQGNPARQVPAHPVAAMNEIEPLFPGSWIAGNFAIWIGEVEENTGWEYLLTARNDMVKSGIVQPDPLAPLPTDKNSADYHVWKAFDEIYAAEGSDWFWWYGGDETSPSNDDSPFDTAFRIHLAGAYAQMNLALQLMGKPTITLPDFKPIIQANPQAPQGPLVPPPTLDGIFSPNESEWADKGGFFFDSDSSGAIANPDDWIATVYYGFGQYQGVDGLYVGVQHNYDLTTVASGGLGVYLSNKHVVNAATGDVTEDPASKLSRFGDALVFQGKGASRELWIGLAGGTATPELRKYSGSGNWTGLAATTFAGKVGGPVKNGHLLEIFIPYTDLGIVAGDPLEMQLVFAKDGKTRDLAPSLQSQVLVDDPTSAVFVTFVCDATGGAIALDTFGPINNPPPPKGKGIVYISGNDAKLGMKTKWVPNKIALRDDGQQGDDVAGDNIWSGVFSFPAGMNVHYKYTIGLPSNEGQWGGTEEFPLTERGLDITKDPSKKKQKVSDVFADRPSVSGQAGSKTLITLQ